MPLFALALLAACDRAEPPTDRGLPMVWVRTDDPAAEGAMGWEEARAGLWWALYHRRGSLPA